MRKISIFIGVIGLIAICLFVVNRISIDYVATVDDELSKLELELAALDPDDLSPEDVLATKNKITSRLDTIQTSLVASEDRTLTFAQQQMLNEGLHRLQTVLNEYQTTLTALDLAPGDSPEFATSADENTIAMLSQTISAIQEYLNIPAELVNPSPKTATYIIEGESVVLVDGVSVAEVVPGSAVLTETNYFGNEVSIDLNDDGREDVVFLLTQSTGGTGMFFYVVAALNTETGWIGSEGFLLGDRISPQTIEVRDDLNHQNVIVVNYADREIDQPMSEAPSVGKSVWLKLETESMTFGTVEQNIPGESNPDLMTLAIQPWNWIKTQYTDDTELVPNQSDAFTLTFTDDGSVTITTDCNSMSGTYEVMDNQITFGPLVSTKMFCQDSQEQDFAAMLAEIQSFSFTTKAELVFELKSDAGLAMFR